MLSQLSRLHFYDCLTALKLEGYVTIDAADQIAVTERGLAALGGAVPEAIRSVTDIIRLWSTALSKREVALLEGLLQGYPSWLARKPLLALTDYSESAANKIGSDLKRLVAFNLAEAKQSGVHRLNPKLLEIPFTGY